MLDWIKEENALTVEELRLFRLARELNGIEQWISTARKIDQLMEKLISFPPKNFWSTLVHSSQMIQLLGSCLDFYIRASYFDELEFYMSLQGGDVHVLFVRIFQRVLLVFLRIIANLEREGIVDALFGHLVYANKIVTIDILVKLCCVYGTENKAALSKLMKKLFAIQIGFKRDLEIFVTSSCQFIEKSRKHIADLISEMENNRIARRVAHTHGLLKTLDNTSNLLLSLSSFVDVYQPVQPWKNLLTSIPQFVDNISRLLTDVNIINLAASTASGSFINLLACKRARILQCGLHAFKIFYRLETSSDKDRFRMIFDNLGHKEFLVRLDDEINVKEKLVHFEASKNCTKEHVKHVTKALDKAYAVKVNLIKISLMQRQMLLNLGKSRNAQIEEVINSLEELLPGYSRAQLHLCLRHFDYNLEKTTNAIIENSELPFELRVLLRNKSDLDDIAPTGIWIPAFSDSHEIVPNTLDGRIQQTSDIQSVFNLKPKATQKDEESERSSKEEKEKRRNAKLEELLIKYDGIFDMSGVQMVLTSIDRAKQVGELKSEAIEIGGKIIVKQDPVRRQLKQPCVKKKIAIRETYDRYKYELSDEDDEDGRYDLDARFAEEVGMSGRFNKPQLKLETALLNVESEVEPNQKPRQSQDQNRPNESARMPTNEARPMPREWVNTSNAKRGTRQGAPARGGIVYRPPHLKSTGATTGPVAANSNSAAQQSRSANYTGARARQTKERNKGKMQQRGADKKARGGMF